MSVFASRVSFFAAAARHSGADGSRRSGAGRAPERARQVRFLRADLVVVAVVLRGGGGARRRPRPPQREQCGDRPFSFVVHGLWPQYDRGFPEFCQVPAPRLNRNIVSSMLDLMPSPRLIFHEWDRHGTCSGLNARAYFDNVRRARAVVKIPEAYLDLRSR